MAFCCAHCLQQNSSDFWYNALVFFIILSIYSTRCLSVDHRTPLMTLRYWTAWERSDRAV